MENTILNNLKIAIVYDRVNKFGGAERVLLTLHEMFPKAPLYTSVYDSKKAPWALSFPKIYTSFLQKIPFAKSNNELLGWLMPIAFETFDFSEYDLVISVTSEAAKGIITGVKTLHVCYCLTPTRYLWSGYEEYFENKLLKLMSKPIVNYLKYWDKLASKRPDKLIAISSEVRDRIKKYYNRDSEIIFPPVDLEYRKKSPLRIGSQTSMSAGKTVRQFLLDMKPYYLYVGRLVKYKKVDLLIDTFNDLGLSLVIVGTGAEESRLKSKAKSNIIFLGQVSDNELISIYKNAKAFLMPQEEDFGITAIEAQSFGIPVIAYNKGGAIDTVVENKSGIFFEVQNKENLKKAIAKFDRLSFNSGYLKKHVKSFSKKVFRRRIQETLVRTYSSWWRWNKTLAKK